MSAIIIELPLGCQWARELLLVLPSHTSTPRGQPSPLRLLQGLHLVCLEGLVLIDLLLFSEVVQSDPIFFLIFDLLGILVVLRTWIDSVVVHHDSVEFSLLSVLLGHPWAIVVIAHLVAVPGAPHDGAHHFLFLLKECPVILVVELVTHSVKQILESLAAELVVGLLIKFQLSAVVHEVNEFLRDLLLLRVGRRRGIH